MLNIRWYFDAKRMSFPSTRSIAGMLLFLVVNQVGEATGQILAERVETRRVDFKNGNFIDNYSDFNIAHGLSWNRRRYYRFRSINRTMVVRVFMDFGFISPDFQIDHLDRYGSEKFHGAGLSGCHFVGNVVGQKNSSVVLDVCHGLQGVMRSSDGTYVIQPINSTVDVDSQPGEHLIRKLPETSRLVYQPEHCAAKAPDNKMKIIDGDYTLSVDSRWNVDLIEVKRRRRRSLIRRRYVETMIVADDTMFKSFGGNEIELRSYLLSMMAIVRRIYQDSSIGNAIDISIVKMMILKKPQADLKIPVSGPDSADVALKNFCKWQRKHNSMNDASSKHFDAAILITKHDICSKQRGCDTLGLAEIGMVCDPRRSCAIIEDNGIAAGFTIAHELGHLFNMAHDGIHNECSLENNDLHIMTPSFSLNADTWSFSKCSRKYITEFLESGGGNCLIDRPSPKVQYKLPKKMAGEIFNHEEQCQLVFGKGYETCSIIKVDCSKLYCQRKGGMVNFDGHPTCATNNMAPAEGTLCADNKWCIEGKCIERKKLVSINGGWGEWSPFGRCSRSCGGGIMSSERDCNNPRPFHGGEYCLGVKRRHRSCNLQPCPRGSKSFRSVQCATFNGKDLKINGIPPTVQWIPKYDGVSIEDSCRLFCQIENHNVYYELSGKVVDGTPCRKGSFDVCVEGQCRPAGCDRVLNSAAKLDRCGVCNGDNTSCKGIHRRIRITTIGYYNFVFRVPKGARNFKVIQRSGSRKPDTVALALLDYRMRYVFNGNYVLGLGKKMFIASGSKIYYSGLNVVNETIWIPGTLAHSFIVHALAVGEPLPVIVDVSYILPAKGNYHYIWMLKDNWSVCSRVCQGIQYREYLCLREIDSQRVSDDKCKKKRPLSQVQKCNRHCKLSWRVKVEIECTARCGDGHRIQSPFCVKKYGNSNESVEVIDNKHCSEMKMPPKKIPCHMSCTDTRWGYTAWGECSKTCDGGVQTRKAYCLDSMLKKLPDAQCDAEKKGALKRSCNEHGCPQWKTSEWSMCSVTCGEGKQDRSVFCVDGLDEKKTVDLKLCNQTFKPDIVRPCVLRACPAWTVGAWSKCSVTCGVGYQTRKIVCRRSDGENIHERQCHAPSRPVDRQECKTRPCPADVHAAIDAKVDEGEAVWMTGAWTMCSVTCGKGIMQRYVSCRYRGGAVAPVSDCDKGNKPESLTGCTVRPCPKWIVGQWSKCSVTCGGGVQTRVVECRAGVHQIASHYCDQSNVPKERNLCNLQDCLGKTSTVLVASKAARTEIQSTLHPPAVWRAGQWSKCSVSCGTGQRTRAVECVASKRSSTCDQSIKPEAVSQCTEMPCPFWNYGQWSICSVSCGQGVQRRLVVCQLNNGTYLDDKACDVTYKPKTEQICENRKCPQIAKWVTSDWQPCTVTCGLGFQYRDISCENEKGERIPKQMCSSRQRPTQQMPCERGQCPTWMAGDWTECNDQCQKTRNIYCMKGKEVADYVSCGIDSKPTELMDCPSENCVSAPEYSWKIGVWGMCSKTCDYSVRFRAVKCVDETGKHVPESHCLKGSPMPSKRQACFGGPCPAKWLPQPWSECSVTCGQGIQQRKVVCESHAEKKLDRLDCSAKNRPRETRVCNMGPCHEKYRWSTGNWTECSQSCNVGVSMRSVQCVDNAGSLCPESKCVVKRPASQRICNAQSCPPTSCRDVQTRNGVFSDGEYALMSKEDRYVKIYCEGMGTSRPREYISLKTDVSDNYSEIYGKRLRNRKTCPINGTRIKYCPSCLDFPSSGTTYFSKIRIDFRRLVLIPEDTTFAIKFGRYPPPLLSAGDCFSQAYCPQGSFKLNLTDTGISLDPSVTWRKSGYFVSQQVDKSADGTVVVGRCGGYCGMCTPNLLKVRCSSS